MWVPLDLAPCNGFTFPGHTELGKTVQSRENWNKTDFFCTPSPKMPPTKRPTCLWDSKYFTGQVVDRRVLFDPLAVGWLSSHNRIRRCYSARDRSAGLDSIKDTVGTIESPSLSSISPVVGTIRPCAMERAHISRPYRAREKSFKSRKLE